MIARRRVFWAYELPAVIGLMARLSIAAPDSQTSLGIECVLFTSSYHITGTGMVEIPRTVRWSVRNGYQRAHATDRPFVQACVDLSLLDDRSKYQPLIIRMDRDHAVALRKDLEKIITVKRKERPGDEVYARTVIGMECATYTAPYDLTDAGMVELPSGTEIKVYGAYRGVTEEGQRYVEDCVLITLVDSARSFWPLVAKMDLETATKLKDGIERVIDQLERPGR